MNNTSAEDWKKDWQRYFQFDPAVQKRMDARLANIKPATGNKRATIELPKGRARPHQPEKAKPAGSDVVGDSGAEKPAVES